jgi:hypothetical protein
MLGQEHRSMFIALSLVTTVMLLHKEKVAQLCLGFYRGGNLLFAIGTVQVEMLEGEVVEPRNRL